MVILISVCFNIINLTWEPSLITGQEVDITVVPHGGLVLLKKKYKYEQSGSIGLPPISHKNQCLQHVMNTQNHANKILLSKTRNN